VRLQELRALGILYESESDSKPEYVIRYTSKHSQRNRRNAVQFSLPIFNASSLLSENAEIAKYLARLPEDSTNITQPRDTNDIDTSTPLSLPLLPDSSFIQNINPNKLSLELESGSASPLSVPLYSPAISLNEDEMSWDFVQHASIVGVDGEEEARVGTPMSEAETWIFLSDDS
jgi:hypothetical protein